MSKSSVGESVRTTELGGRTFRVTPRDMYTVLEFCDDRKKYGKRYEKRKE